MAALDTAYPILINFRQERLKRLRMGYDATKWQILPNMASTGPVWPVVGNGGHLWSGISSLNALVRFKSELRDLGTVYQIIACTATWDKIGQIWSKMAYNVPVFVIVSRYDRLGPYLSLYYNFWAALSLSVRFDHLMIKVPAKSESGQKWSIIIQNVLSWRGVTNCGHIWHRIANSDQFSTSANAKDTYFLWRHLVADTA